MNMKKNLLFFLILNLLGFSVYALDVNDEVDKKPKREKDTTGVKKGWNFGILPSVAFDADLGFQFGALSNIFYYGDGSTYPEYLHSLYVEIAYTTKRYGIFRFNYDSKYLIPKHRFSFDATYLPDAMCDFYGFNGYSSIFNDNWRNSKKYSVEEGYKSRAFYKFKRDLLRVAADIQGTIHKNWKWSAGAGFLGYWADQVNLNMLNKNKDEESRLPDIPGLYEKYVHWKLIDQAEAKGGMHPYVRAGFVYDSRNKLTNASKGMYSDLFLTYTAAFGEQKAYNNLKLNFVFQHYVPVYKDYITFAYRLGFQTLLAGESPFYMDSYLNTLYIQRVMYEAVGGANSIRGILRNRVLADGFGYANVEFRFKVWKFDIGRQHFYLGFNPFVDMGLVLQPNELDENLVKENVELYDPSFDMSELDSYFNFDSKSVYLPHFSAGVGAKIAMNENFVLSVDWAMPFKPADGASKANFYIKMGYLF